MSVADLQRSDSGFPVGWQGNTRTARAGPEAVGSLVLEGLALNRSAYEARVGQKRHLLSSVSWKWASRQHHPARRRSCRKSGQLQHRIDVHTMLGAVLHPLRQCTEKRKFIFRLNRRRTALTWVSVDRQRFLQVRNTRRVVDDIRCLLREHPILRAMVCIRCGSSSAYRDRWLSTTGTSNR